jgi:hypothetical protein
MKYRSMRSSLIIGSILCIMISSCLKDKNFENGTIQSGSGGSGQDIKVVSLGLQVSNSGYSYTDYNDKPATYPNVQFLQQAYPLTQNDTLVNLVPVELGGISNAKQDIHVTLSQDTTLVNTYNDSTGASYTNPGSVINIVSNVVTIPKGSRTGYLQVKFKISDLLTGNFAYGFRITSVAESGYTISGNLSAGVVGIGPANPWYGDYTVTGWFFHPTSGRAIKTTKHLNTVSLIRNLGGVGDLGTPFQFDVVNNIATNWFSNGFVASGFMTADDPGSVDFSDPSNGGHIPGDATFNSTIYNNTYDPTTKTFYLHYGYCNGGCTSSSTQSGYTRQIYEKWVKK